MSVGSKLCALSVWLVAQYHLQLCHCHPDFLFALGTVQRKFHQDGIGIHLSPRPATADWAAHPMGRFILFVHTPLPFPATITLCVQRPAFVIATFTIEGLIVDSS